VAGFEDEDENEAPHEEVGEQTGCLGTRAFFSNVVLGEGFG